MGANARRVMDVWQQAAAPQAEASEIEELRTKLAAFERAERLADVGSWQLDLRTNEVRWSPHMYRMNGLPEGAPVPSVMESLDQVHPDDVDLLVKAGRALITEGKVEPFTYRVVRPGGEIRTVLVRAEAVFDADGKPLLAAGTLADVTERLRVEERILHREKLQDIGRVVGSVAHDMNNLLGVVVASATVAERASTEEPVKNELARLLTACGSSAELLRQLLAFARRQELAPRVIGLDEIVAPLEWIVKRLVGPQVRIVLDMPDSWRIRADAGAIERVIVNLALNARDAMPRGGTLTLRTVNRVAPQPDKPGEYTQLSVVDDGEGMSAEVKARLFEPFFTTKGAAGTGLGLATARSIVQELGGFITVTSEVDRGTTIDLFFPRA